MKTLTINKLEELDAAAQALSLCLAAGDTILLNGELGSGKSEFTRRVLKHLGVTEEITSPTFCFVNEYRAGSLGSCSHTEHDPRDPARYLYHFDIYRLEDESQLEEIGFDEKGYNPPDGVAFIEWSDKFADCMPQDALHIDFYGHGDNPRELKIYGNDLADRWVSCLS